MSIQGYSMRRICRPLVLKKSRIDFLVQIVEKRSEKNGKRIKKSDFFSQVIRKIYHIKRS